MAVIFGNGPRAAIGSPEPWASTLWPYEKGIVGCGAGAVRQVETMNGVLGEFPVAFLAARHPIGPALTCKKQNGIFGRGTEDSSSGGQRAHSGIF